MGWESKSAPTQNHGLVLPSNGKEGAERKGEGKKKNGAGGRRNSPVALGGESIGPRRGGTKTRKEERRSNRPMGRMHELESPEIT